MLKILPIILSRTSQNFHLLFFFILVSCLLFQTNSHLVSVASHDLTALLEYLRVLLEYIEILKAFSSFSASTCIIMSAIYHS